MKKHFKLFLIIITIFMLIGTLSACNNQKDYDFKDENFGYKIDVDKNGNSLDSVTVTKWLNKSNGDVVIPKSVVNKGKTYTISTLGNGLFAANPIKLTAKDIFGNYPETSNDKLKSVTFEEGSQLKIIMGRTFEKCTAIKSIILPETVTKIEGFAFYKCSNLTDVTINKNVEFIGDDCFSGCKKLKNVNLLHDDINSLPEVGDRAFKWYDESVKSFMGTNNPYKVLKDLKLNVTNEKMKTAFTSTGTSTNMNIRYWNDYSSHFTVIGG